uniref:Uncharacterized protein n=1 Tax=Amphimedon queenslandica TaxID=400682 RepID=A0A1X7TUS8_AMPQE
METEKCQIEALTRDIEQSRAELKEQEDDFKHQLQKQEQELTRISTWLHKHQAEFKVCLSKKEQLERKYDADVKKLLEEHSKPIETLADEGEKTKGELMKAKEQFFKEKTKLEKRIKELEQGETDRVKEMEEEIQILSAQVNAYSREVEKQKGLRTQSQEKYKTEVNELNERLANEIKTKQQLNNELVEMRQQLDSVSKKHETETAELQEKSKQIVQQLHQMIQGAYERLENERKSKEQLASELAGLKQQLANVSADKKEAIYSQQQLASELAGLRHQFDAVSVNYDQLRTAYHEERAEVTRLEDQMKKMKQANVKLKDSLQQLRIPSTPQPMAAPQDHSIRDLQRASYPVPITIGTHQNFVPSAPVPGGPKQVVQSDGDGVLIVSKTEGVTPAHHTDSDSVPEDSPPLMSKEEMARMFKSRDQQGSSDWTQSPQQVKDSLVKEQRRQELAMKVDDAILEVERMRESQQNVKKQSSVSTKKVPSPSQQTSSKQKTKPKVKKNQAKQQASDDSESDIEENKLIDNIDEEIQQMAEDVRKGSRGPTTAEKLKAYKSRATPTTDNPRLSAYGGGARDEYVMNQKETHHHSNQLHSDDVAVANVRPLMTAEDMAKLFKQQQEQPAPQQQQPAASYRPERQPPQLDYNTPPSLIQSEADTDKLLKELDQSRKTYAATPRNPSPVLPRLQSPLPELDSPQELPEDDKDNNDDKGRPLDPNLICPKCGKQYRVGQIQKLRRHMNAPCSNEDSDESDEETDKDEEEIRQMAEQRRKEMQGPSTAEVLFNDDNSSLPYDPNLVCPKCGKQYRVGEIQKLRRHLNEFCTGIR